MSRSRWDFWLACLGYGLACVCVVAATFLLGRVFELSRNLPLTPFWQENRAVIRAVCADSGQWTR